MPDVTFSTISNGARNSAPYIHAQADGVRVRFIEREREDYIGWRCDEHGNRVCSHVEAVEPYLSRRILDRIDHLTGRW